MAKTATASKITSGQVVITLDGEDLTLKPTPRAALAISRAAGGMQDAIRRLAALDVDMIAAVVNAGLNRSGDAAKKTAEEAFAAGFDGIAGKCIDFVVMLSNGGKPRDEQPADSEEDADQGNG